MRARASFTWAGLITAIACAEDSRFVAFPEIPPDTQSLILIPRSAQSLFAMEETTAIELPLEEVEPDLLLLGYPRPLGELGLDAGTFPTGATCRDCALLQPSSALFREAERDWVDLHANVPDWAKIALVSDAESRCSGCPSLESERLSVPDTNEFSSLEIARWDDGHILVIDEITARYFKVNAAGEVSPACSAEGNLFVRASFRGEGPDLWLIDPAGVVHRMNLDALDPSLPCRAATSTFTTPLGTVAHALHVSSTSAEPVIHALEAPSGRIGGPAYLHRFDEGQWTLVHTFARTEGVASLALGLDDTLYAVVGGDELARVKDGVVTTWMPVDPTVGYELTVVAQIPGFGVLTASRLHGLLLPNPGGTWTAVEDDNQASLGGERFGAIVPYGTGVLLGNYQGGLHYYSAETGYCNQLTLFGRVSSRTLTQLPNGLLFAAESELYRARPRENGCER